jgi:hypothetical protein
VYYTQWREIENLTSYSQYLNNHVKLISNKSHLQPLLILSRDEGAGLMLGTEVQSSNSLAKVKWSVSQSKEPYIMVQGKAFWFASFPKYCQIIIDN